jgi:hypothetical protein
MATKRSRSKSSSSRGYLEFTSIELMKPTKELIHEYGSGFKFDKIRENRKVLKPIASSSHTSSSSGSTVKTSNIPLFKFIEVPNHIWTKESEWSDTIRKSLWNTFRPENVKSVYLYFFKLKDFQTIPERSSSRKSAIYKIETEQDTFDEKQVQTMMTAELNLPPIIVDKELDKHGKIQFRLVDGNHRLITLKRLKYKGNIPVVVNDYTSTSDPYQ